MLIFLVLRVRMDNFILVINYLKESCQPLAVVLSGILRDKTMGDKLIYISNNDKHYPFRKLELLVEKFGQYWFDINPSKFNKITQSF